MEKLSDRIKDFPTEQFIDWLCLSCVDVRASHSDELAQEDINKIREAVTVRLATLEDKLRIKQNHIKLRDSYIEELEERAEEAEAERDAVAAENLAIKAKVAIHAAGFSVCPVCSHEDPSETDDIVWMVNETPTPSTDAYANQLRAEGVEMFAKYCWSMEHTRADRRWVGAARNAELFAANLRKENGNG